MNGASKLYSLPSSTVQVLSLILRVTLSVCLPGCLYVTTLPTGAPRDSAISNSTEDLFRVKPLVA